MPDEKNEMTEQEQLEETNANLLQVLRYLRQEIDISRGKLTTWLDSRVAGLPIEAYQQIKLVRNELSTALTRTKGL